MTDLTSLTITEAGAAIRHKHLTSVTLTEALLKNEKNRGSGLHFSNRELSTLSVKL